MQTHTPRPRRNGKTPSRRRRRQTRTYAPAGAQRPSAGRRPPGPAATRWRRRTVRSAAGRRHCWWGHPVAAARVARRRDEGHPTWMHLCFRGHWSCLRGRVGSVSRRWGSTRRGWQLKAPPPHRISTGPPRETLGIGGGLPCGSVLAGCLRAWPAESRPRNSDRRAAPAPRRPGLVSWGHVVAPLVDFLEVLR